MRAVRDEPDEARQGKQRPRYQVGQRRQERQLREERRRIGLRRQGRGAGEGEGSPTTFFNRGSPAKAEDSSGANRTIPRVDPADKAKEAERAQAGSAPTKSRRHSPNALSAELRRLAQSANSPVAAMTAARSADTGIPVNAT